nr:hypothetical protein [uncultured Desulfobacter sp.]
MTNDKEILVMQYQELCSLHQFYLKMVFSSALFVNAIMSGVAVYVLEESRSGGCLQWALLFPIAMSLSYGFVLFKAKPKCQEFKYALDSIVDMIDVEVGPHVSLTIDMISIFSILYSISGVGLIILFFYLLH